MAAIDLNSDLGESFGVWVLGDDAALLEIVTSANVACGFHAGDPSTLRRTCALAAGNGVRIGAQVSYPDLVGFGRRAMAVDADELRDLVLYQFGALDAFAYADARTRRDLARVDRLRAHFNAVFTSQILSFYLGRPLTF